MKTFTIVLSEGCNLDCAYCGVDKRSTRTIDPVKCLTELRAFYDQYPNDIIEVGFFGGEPLMQMSLIRQLVDGMAGMDRIKKVMPTNGLLLTRQIVDYLVANDFRVSVSFDGLWQDKNRLQLTGKTTSKRLLDKVDLIKQLPDLRIHTMITRGCYNLLENHLYIMREFGVNPELTLVRDVGTWTAHSVNRVIQGIDELFDWYIDNASSVEMPAFIMYYLRHFLNYHVRHHVKQNCGAGLSTQFFDNDRVIPCTRFSKSPELLDKITDFYVMSECSTCPVRNYCEKGCLIEQIRNERPIEELCTIYKFIYNKVSIMTSKLQQNSTFQLTILKEIEDGSKH